MNWIILFLLACNILVPIVFVVRQCVSSGEIEFNHVLLFSVGYVVYWVTPIAVGESHLFPTAVAMTVWYRLFNRIPESTLALYLLMCLSIYLAFCAGIFVCRRLRPGFQTTALPFFFDRRLLNIFLVLGAGAGLIYTFVLRGDLFRGYTTGDASSNVGTRGSFVAISVFLLSLAILYSLKRQEKLPGIGFCQTIFNHFFFVYLAAAILVLSLGGRLYFFSSILMLVVYRSVYFRRIGYRSFLLFASVGGVLLGIVGSLRIGTSFSFSDVLFNLVAEPLFNGFSLLQFLIDGRFDLVNLPIFLGADFINLLPTVLFPQKTAYIPDPGAYGFHIFTPLGSLSSFLSFMINFGFFGTLLAMFFLAFFLQHLRSRGRTLLEKTMYIMVSGWLATTFFRDAFAVSLVKTIFQYSILFPCIIVFAASWVTWFLTGKQEQETSSPVPEALP